MTTDTPSDEELARDLRECWDDAALFQDQLIKRGYHVHITSRNDTSVLGHWAAGKVFFPLNTYEIEIWKGVNI